MCNNLCFSEEDKYGRCLMCGEYTVREVYPKGWWDASMVDRLSAIKEYSKSNNSYNQTILTIKYELKS